MSDPTFERFVDLAKARGLLEAHYRLAGLPVHLCAPDGRKLAGAGMRAVCAQCPWGPPPACVKGPGVPAEAGAATEGRCPAGLAVMAMPVFLGGHHVASFHLGPFLPAPPGAQEPVPHADPPGRAPCAGAPDRVPDCGREQVRSQLRFLCEAVQLLAAPSPGEAGGPGPRPELDALQTERDRMALALAAREREFRTLAENSPDNIIRYDRGGRCIYANPRAAQTLGMPLEDLLGRTVREQFPRGEFPEYRDKLEGVLSTGREAEMEISVPAPGAAPRCHHIRFAPERGRDGSLIGVLAIGRDITELKEALASLRSSNLILSAQQEASPDGILVVGPRGEVLSSNKRFAEIWGIPDDLLARGSSRLMIRTVMDQLCDPEAFARKVRHLYEHPEATSLDELLFNDGRILERHSCPILAEDGRYQGRIWHFRDITSRRKAEEQIKASEEKFSKAFHTIPIPASLSRMRDGLLLEVNDVACRILGRAREELVGRTSLELGLFTEADRQRLMEALASGRRLDDFEMAFLTQDGTEIPGLLFIERFQAGGEDLLLLMALDLRERKRAEELQRKLDAEHFQLQKLDSLGSLASGVAHDMNNVLAAIQAVTETLGVLHGEDEELLGLLRIIDAASTRGRDLVARLTNFARKDIRDAEILDLNGLVQEEMKLLARTTFQKVRLATDLQERLPRVLAERSSITSALMNLCVNAVDAMPSGGTLTLRTRSRPEGGVEIQVEDTGQGMSEAVLARALEPFFTTKPLGKGTGMGLSMAYATMKAHGGSLHIQSRQGQGTLVTLQFPETVPDEEEPASPGAQPGLARPLRVLVVDDDELVLASVPAMIGTLGHDVATASGGPQALALLEAGESFDAIVLDLNMPGMNGLEFLEILRETRPGMPVIVGTGHLDEATARTLKRDTCVCCLLKPYTRLAVGQKLLAIGRLSQAGPDS